MRRMPRPPDDEQLQMTSLIDMSFLLLIFFMCLPFKGFDHKLQAYLPREGKDPTSAPSKETVKIRVRRQGDEISYTLGQNAAPSAEGLEPVLRALGSKYAYEIDAGATVPWQGVVDMVNVLASVECEDVRFRGGALPAAERRRR